MGWPHGVVGFQSREQLRHSGNGRWQQGYSDFQQAHSGQGKGVLRLAQKPNFDNNPLTKIFREKPFIQPVLDLPLGKQWLNRFACLDDISKAANRRPQAHSDIYDIFCSRPFVELTRSFHKKFCREQGNLQSYSNLNNYERVASSVQGAQNSIRGHIGHRLFIYQKPFGWEKKFKILSKSFILRKRIDQRKKKNNLFLTFLKKMLLYPNNLCKRDVQSKRIMKQLIMVIMEVPSIQNLCILCGEENMPFSRRWKSLFPNRIR